MRHPPDFASLRERTTTPAELRSVKWNVLARQAKHRTRVQRATIASAIALATAISVFAFFRLRSHPAQNVAKIALATPAQTSASFGGLVTADGSRVTFLAAGTDLAQASARQVTLVHGAARFDVVHDPASPFRVVAGTTVIEDVGTVFTVSLVDAEHTSVHVEAGSVRVRCDGVERVMVAGEEATFTAGVGPLPSASIVSIPPLPPSVTWQKLARDGDYDKAYAMMSHGVPAKDPEELLLAADAARYSGHSEKAVDSLRDLLSRFPDDSRAGLAAFTLGRVLLDELGRAREAADAFATAHEKGGPLAEDALAREAEAFTKAGDDARAKSTATRYLATYPNGRHAAAARKLTATP
ncbi:hypothetical protein BH09MYX1_BH09MYX1_25680 [soil metagenome]